MIKLLFCCLLCCSSLKADVYEGSDMFRNNGKIDLEMLPQFLPYNPIIVEAGACYGNETIHAAKLWAKGHIFAFEPNPLAFLELEKKIQKSFLQNVEICNLALSTWNGSTSFYVCYGMKGEDAAFEYSSSVLPTTPEMQIYCRGPQIQVPCVILDDWCKQKGIDHIDLLRLELEGLELDVLKSSPDILKTVQVLYIKTFIHPYRVHMTQYEELKAFLERSNFVLLSHWYQPGIIGYAIFLNQELFNTYFK